MKQGDNFFIKKYVKNILLFIVMELMTNKISLVHKCTKYILQLMILWMVLRVCIPGYIPLSSLATILMVSVICNIIMDWYSPCINNTWVHSNACVICEKKKKRI